MSLVRCEMAQERRPMWRHVWRAGGVEGTERRSTSTPERLIEADTTISQNDRIAFGMCGVPRL